MNKLLYRAKSKTGGDAYFQLGEAWEQELYSNLRRSRRLAWGVAVVSLSIAALSVLAVIALTPLKTTTPYVILVDKSTGYLEQIEQVQPGTITENETVIRAGLVRFLQDYESWDPADFQERARAVRLNATDRVYQFYLAAINKLAEDLTSEDLRRIFIKSISLDPEEQTAFIRYQSETVDQFNTVEEHWVATLAYRFTRPPTDRDIAFINPLGFQVTSIRIDQESVRETP